MNAEKRQLAVIGLINAACACAALTFDYEFFAVVFVLESAVANRLAFARTATIAFTVEASTGPVSRIRAPLVN